MSEEAAVMVEDSKEIKIGPKDFLILRTKDSKGRNQQNLPNKSVIY